MNAELWEKALAEGKAGDWTAALETFRRAKEGKDDYAADHNCGIALFQLEKYSEAVQSFQQALAVNPEYWQAYNHLGMALERLGRNEEALAAYRKAVELKQDYQAAWINLSNAYSLLGQTAQAAQALKKSFY